MYLKKFVPRAAIDVLTDKIINEIQLFDTENIIPYCSDPFTELNGIVFDEEDVVAVGVNKIVNEFKVIVNPAIGRFRISQAIKALIIQAIEDMKEKGSNEILAVVTQGGMPYEKFLERHFKFEKISGALMKRGI